jgi:hypothetical protein
MKIIFCIAIVLFLIPANLYAFVLVNATTLGFNKVSISTLYSTNTIKTTVPDLLSADLSNYATGLIFQYGLLENVDLMLGIGNISYIITPNAVSLLKMKGGMLTGIAAKVGLVKEGASMPVSVALLLQHTSFPAILTQSGDKMDGWVNDTYYKLILSRNINAFLPYIAFGIDSRIMRMGQKMRSDVSISEIDLGYGTAISQNLFVGVEANFSFQWHDKLMDEMFSAITSDRTRSDAFGYSFGIGYVY